MHISYQFKRLNESSDQILHSLSASQMLLQLCFGRSCPHRRNGLPKPQSDINENKLFEGSSICIFCYFWEAIIGNPKSGDARPRITVFSAIINQRNSHYQTHRSIANRINSQTRLGNFYQQIFPPPQNFRPQKHEYRRSILSIYGQSINYKCEFGESEFRYMKDYSENCLIGRETFERLRKIQLNGSLTRLNLKNTLLVEP